MTFILSSFRMAAFRIIAKSTKDNSTSHVLHSSSVIGGIFIAEKASDVQFADDVKVRFIKAHFLLYGEVSNREEGFTIMDYCTATA